MADIKYNEKRLIEKFLEMEGGYVLDFSNRTIQEFIFDVLNIDIYHNKYDYDSGSKANRLRAFMQKEPNHIVGHLLSNLLGYWRKNKLSRSESISNPEEALFNECHKIAERLKQDSPVEDIDVIQSNTEDKNFSLLAESIRESIQKNNPEAALDRLHTFVMKYVRNLCDKHKIEYDRNNPLHSLFGGYVKHLKYNNLIDSLMTERILKSSISILEAFNDVRNNQSLAHDNPILNYNESILIFNNVSSAIKFIESIEQFRENNNNENTGTDWNEIPF